MNKALKITTFSMLGLLLSNSQVVYSMSQATDLSEPMSRSMQLSKPMSQTEINNHRNLLMEIQEFFMGLSGVKVNCAGGSTHVSKGKIIAKFNNVEYTGTGVGAGKECNVFFTGSTIGPVGPERTSNVVALNKPQMMSQQEKNKLMKIHAYFLLLENEGKVMIVSQEGTNLPNEEPIAQYLNPKYTMKAKGKTMLSGGARKEVLIFATPFHTTGFLGTEGMMK